MEKEYKAKEALNQQCAETTIEEFNMNTKQERAFRLIASHSQSKAFPQLKVYIGGMDGTGKLRVIKALVSFFEKRKEGHQILLLAPTGSAASLISGYTYHSALSIRASLDGVSH